MTCIVPVAAGREIGLIQSINNRNWPKGSKLCIDFYYSQCSRYSDSVINSMVFNLNISHDQINDQV